MCVRNVYILGVNFFKKGLFNVTSLDFLQASILILEPDPLAFHAQVFVCNEVSFANIFVLKTSLGFHDNYLLCVYIDTDFILLSHVVAADLCIFLGDPSTQCTLLLGLPGHLCKTSNFDHLSSSLLQIHHSFSSSVISSSDCCRSGKCLLLVRSKIIDILNFCFL